jgi:hypothetical protein
MRKIWFYNGNDVVPGQIGGDLGYALGENPSFLSRKDKIAPRSLYSIPGSDNQGKRLCSPVVVGDEIYLYYEGFDGTRWQTFLEIYGKDMGLRYRSMAPIIPHTALPGSHSLQRPSVLYEPDDTAAPFKMVLSRGISSMDPTQFVVTTSTDGFVWATPVAAFGITEPWEGTMIVSSGSLVNDNGTYRLFYSGKSGNPLRWRSAVASNASFSPTGWAKSAPVLAGKSSAVSPIAVNTSPSNKQVSVVNASAFDIGAPVLVGNGITSCEWNVIQSKSGNVLTMERPFLGGYPAGTGVCAQIHSGSVDITQAWKEGEKWCAVFTCFEFFLNLGFETSGYAETDDLNSGFIIKPSAWPLPMINKYASWDRTSAENLKFVEVP